tara:strand:+ start:673 stop:1266 length:594 start_codon:yes stop_codon:yes gene_type:complete
MGIISRTGDLFYAFRFLKLLVTPWEETKAFEQGIVDENGKTVKKSRDLQTTDEKSAYTVFHRLVFNIKRLLEKLPFGRNKLASYAAALFLIKEETNLSEAQIRKVLEKVLGEPIDFDDIISETSWFQQDDHLLPGVYSLVEDIASPLTGEIIAFTKSKIKVTETLAPYDNFFGANIYEVYHPQTNQKIFISNRDIKR